jgi:phosphatidylinositol glycan class N
MIAGGLMFVVGAFYLAFEERILANTESQSSSGDANTSFKSRMILGVQVGCILIASTPTDGVFSSAWFCSP